MEPSTPPGNRSRFFRLLVLGAVALLAIGGIVGYLVGIAGIQQATLHVNVENRFGSDLTAQIIVNGRVRQTVVIPAGQIVSVDERVTFGGSDGAFFEIQAISTGSLRDADSVLVNSSGTYVVSLRLG